jgi:hypothetical protein
MYKRHNFTRERRGPADQYLPAPRLFRKGIGLKQVHIATKFLSSLFIRDVLVSL